MAEKNDREVPRNERIGAKDGTQPPASSIKRFDVQDLLQGNQEAVIVHKGEDYRLRLTSKGKLLLSK